MSASSVRNDKPLAHEVSTDPMSLEDVTYLGGKVPYKILKKTLVTGYTQKGLKYQYTACEIK